MTSSTDSRSHPRNSICTLQEVADLLKINRKTLAEAFKRHTDTPGVVLVGRQWRINISVFMTAWDRGELSLGISPQR